MSQMSSAFFSSVLVLSSFKKRIMKMCNFHTLLLMLNQFPAWKKEYSPGKGNLKPHAYPLSNDLILNCVHKC